MEYHLSSPISSLRGIGPALAKRFARLGVETVGDLLLHFPTRYDDLSKITDIADAENDVQVTVRGRLTHIEAHRSYRRRVNLTEAIIADDSDSLKIVWFNQPYLAETLKQGDDIYLTGKIQAGKYGRQMMSPEYEKAKSVQTHVARIVPIYPSTEKLTQKQIRFAVQSVIHAVHEFKETLPEDVVASEALMPLVLAIEQIHFPKDAAMLASARKRLKFDELLLVQLRNLRTQAEIAEQSATPLPLQESLIREFVKSLPFALTNAQRKATWTILQDLARPNPMNRLLEGDVGTGKTVVAGIACYNAALSDMQSVIMAPTEILAEQHYQTLSQFFPEDVSIALLTNNFAKVNGKDVQKAELKKRIGGGGVSVVIGTHAVIQKDIAFRNLGLAVIDEQHRFGVEQRKALKDASGDTATAPHLLSMTATPIPRTLALTMYGDLHISLLDEFPKGRKPILTKVVASNNRPKAHTFIAERLEKGRQAFVVCPLIEESDTLGVKSVTEEYEKLRKVFAKFTIEMLHGKMKAREKEAIMERMKKGEIDILVSTSVIEVGIDIPNATMMIIEGADRFGLAQLHQFRGRVGRGAHQSFCFVFTESGSEKTQERLRALTETQSGFELAEKDLEIRGSGDLFGTAQSGFPKFKIATFFDFAIAKRARVVAEQILEADADLAQHPVLHDTLRTFESSIHFE